MSFITPVINWFFNGELASQQFKENEYRRGHAAGQHYLHLYGDDPLMRLSSMTPYDRGFANAFRDYRRKHDGRHQIEHS